jgi:N-succinyldiaminopimelate aminotransferase
MQGATGASDFPMVNLSIGEPKHATPSVILEAIKSNLSGVSTYPATAGSVMLREAIAQWLQNRYKLSGIDPQRHVLPVLGSREALFALTQVVISRSEKPIVLSPNPFYQIYEGAALLAAAQPYYLPQEPSNDFACDWSAIPEDILTRTELLFVCSPGNPTGRVMPLSEWQTVFELADRYNFVIASDECYSEIYDDTHPDGPPLGVLQAAQLLGRGWERLICFTSLSKRSSAPGLRSGFVAGDPDLIAKFLLYRTYHGSAMSLMIQAASAAAWNDEVHVEQNRQLYRQKFDETYPLIAAKFGANRPQAGFYYWLKVPGSDTEFVRELFIKKHVLALPGSFLSREVNGYNPGSGFIRLALVEPVSACQEGVNRLCSF